MKQAWLPSAGVLLLLGMIPGMPNLLFLLASGITFFIWYRIKQKDEDSIEGNDNLLENSNSSKSNDKSEKDDNEINLSDIADNSAISMQLGYGLIQMVDDENEGPLIARITGVRKQISKEVRFHNSTS